MKKRLLYIVALILTGIANSAFVYGQGGSMLEKLQGKIWRYQGYSHPIDEKFTCCTRMFVGDRVPADKPFYLSDTPETKFDHSKVGKIQNGKYLIVEGIPGRDNEWETWSISVSEIVKLNDTELTFKLRDGSFMTYRALESCTIKNIMSLTPNEKTPFSGRGKAVLNGYNFPVNNKTIPDRLYSNVQLTQYKTVSESRGKFLRKFQLTSGYYIVIVSFGNIIDDRTDILCLVDKNGNILDRLEGQITVAGVTAKEYTVISTDGTVYVSQVVPTQTPPLLFETFSSFLGNVVVSTYKVVNGKFVKQPNPNTAQTKTFARSRMLDPDLSVSQY